MVLFSNQEGSIIAKAENSTAKGGENLINSQSAVLANICNEYLDFGNQAFNNNTLECLLIQHDGANILAKPIFNLVLCFVCDRTANLGIVRAKIENMAKQLSAGLDPIKEFLKYEDKNYDDK